MRGLKNIFSSVKALVILDQAIFSGGSFLVTLLSARILSKNEFGMLSGFILVLYFTLGLNNAVVVQPMQVSIPKIQNKINYLTFSFYMQLSSILLTVLLMNLLLLVPQLSEYNKHALLFTTFTFCFLLHDYFRKSRLANDRVKAALTLDILSTVPQFIVFIILAKTESEIKLTQLLGGLSVAYIPSLLYGLFTQNYTFHKSPEWKHYFTMHLKQGGWLLPVVILQWFSSNLFTLVSGAYLGLEALGAFRLIQAFFGIFSVLLQTFENYVLPKASRLYAESVQQSKDYLKKITVRGALLFIPFLVLMFIFSEEVILMAGGEKFVRFGYVVKFMVVLYTIIYIGYPVRIGIRLLVFNKHFFKGYAISFLFSVATFHFLLRYGNLAGAVSGLIINQLIMLAYWQYQLNQKQFSIWK